ncbi:MAG: TonB-dependent receptor [Rhodocyclaceae bacterium]|nr:TonB-dependent receptor [Rhodocyclaceae bacterium]
MSKLFKGRRQRARGRFAVFPLVLPLFLLPIVRPASAAEPVTDATVLVTATRQPFHVEEAPFAVEVYTRADIERSGAAAFLDFLASQTSLTVLPGFGNPNQRVIDMRGYGLESGFQNVVITIDGYRVNEIDSAAQFLGNIPLASVERVEIVRGAGGVTAGEGAMAGAINIVTREYDGASLRGHIGSHGQRAATLSLGQSRDRYSFAIDASHDERDGLAERDRRGQRDDNRLDSLNARGRFRPADWLELRAGFNGYDSLSIYREAIPRALLTTRPNANAGMQGVYNRQDSQSLRGNAGFLADIGAGFSLEYDHNGEDKTYAFNSAFGPFTSDYLYASDRAVLRWVGGKVSLLAGYESFRGTRDLASGFGNSQVQRDSSAVFAQGLWRLGVNTLSAGLRGERVDYRYADATNRVSGDDRLGTWELGANRRLDARFSVFASYTRGAQAPDIDRFTAPDPVTFAPVFNGLISPARSDTVSFGGRYVYVGTRLDVTAFHVRLRDEIYATSTALSPFFVNTNLDRTRKYGVEVQWVQNLTDALQGRLAYTRTEALIDREAADPATGQAAIRDRVLPGVPKHGLNLTLDWRIDEATRVTLSQLYRSSAFAIGDFDNNGFRQRPYRLTNLLLTRQVGGNLQVFAAVDNLFEQRNALYTRDGMAGFPADYTRLWRFGVRADF